MENSSDKKQFIEKILQIEYEKKGFLLEDDIIDACIEYDLDLVEIDSLCDRLLHQKMIVKDTETRKNSGNNDSYVDKSHLDYDALLEKIKFEYSNCTTIIDAIAGILPPQTREWQTMIGEAKNGNAYAKERMVKMYLRTVMKQAYYFSKDNYCDFEEAFQNGVIGLMTAIEKYDMTSLDLFPTYFPLRVRQTMQRKGNIRGTILRYPVHYREQLNIIVSDASRIIEEDNLEEAVSLVTDKTKLQSRLSEVEISKYILPYLEIPDDLEAEDDIEILLQRTMKEHVTVALRTLKDRQRQVLELRYGLVDDQERTLEEVGGMLNITRERVRQIEEKALEKLRQPSQSEKIKDYL